MSTRKERKRDQGKRRFRLALLKPGPDGEVTDEQIDAFLRALGLDPAKVPETREEAKHLTLKDQLLDQ